MISPSFSGLRLIFDLGVHQRILAPLDGPPSALPVFPDDESWYYYVCRLLIPILFNIDDIADQANVFFMVRTICRVCPHIGGTYWATGKSRGTAVPTVKLGE